MLDLAPAPPVDNPWTSERIHAAYQLMLLDIVVKALWPRWFRGLCHRARLAIRAPEAWDHPGRGHELHASFDGPGCGDLGRRGLSADEYGVFCEWALAHGEYVGGDYDTRQRQEARVALYRGQPDPPVIAWLRAMPHRCKAMVARSRLEGPDGLPPMFGPEVGPVEGWTVWTRSGWAPSDSERARMTEPPWNPITIEVW